MTFPAFRQQQVGNVPHLLDHLERWSLPVRGGLNHVEPVESPLQVLTQLRRGHHARDRGVDFRWVWKSHREVASNFPRPGLALALSHRVAAKGVAHSGERSASEWIVLARPEPHLQCEGYHRGRNRKLYRGVDGPATFT